MSPIVEVEAVCKRFGTVSVLEGVSFQVRPGSVVAIIGRSGSGKSTALRCINRLETIDAGHIRVCGHHPSWIWAACTATSASCSRATTCSRTSRPKKT
jgi:ABC-type polar amino acid transport system ATPase subunit